MGRSKESFSKKEIQKRKEKKRKEKEKKKLERKENESDSSLDSMIAYVDEYGRITDTPPDPDAREEVKLEDIEISVPSKGSVEEEDPVHHGIVSFFNDDKGYGFIKDSETKQTVFVHINNLIDPIKEGNAVTFEVVRGPKGLAATQVRLNK